MPSSTPTTEPLPLPATKPVGGGRRRRGGRVLIAVLVLLALLGVAGWVWLRGVVGPIPVREHCTATANGATVQFDPDQAGNAAIIAAIAVRRGLPARAGSIGIATAIQESKLRNIAHGDRDSLGLFQQRPSQGWGTPAQVQDPVYASNAFFDALVKIEGYEDMVITEVAQQVQRSAYPAAYADHEPEGRVLASALAGYSPAALTCVLREPTSASADPARVAETARAETGRRAQVDGSTLTFAVRGERLGWSLAQWAVARGHALGIVDVATDGRRWSRTDSTAGWQPDAAAPAAGTVTVRLTTP